MTNGALVTVRKAQLLQELRVKCLLFEAAMQLDAQIEQDGFVLEGPRGAMKPHPLLKIRDTWFKSFLEGCKQFGLSPSSRARLPAPPESRTRHGDPFSEFLRGNASPAR